MLRSSGVVAFASHNGNYLNRCDMTSLPYPSSCSTSKVSSRRRSKLFQRSDDKNEGEFPSNNVSMSSISLLEPEDDDERVAMDVSINAVSTLVEDSSNEAPLMMDQTKPLENVDTQEKLSFLQSIALPSNSILLLNFVAIIWGSQHAIIKTCVSDLDPSSFSLVRFLIGASIATVGVLPLNSSKTDNISDTTTKNQIIDGTTLRWGAEMGLWMFLGYAFQAVGLEYTSAQKSGFLLYLNVKFVPFFAFALLGRSISLPTWVSAFSALIGTALLAYDGNSLNLNIGDAWSIAAAAASAMYILRLERASAAVPNSAALNATCLWFVAGASIIWSAQRGLLRADPVIGALTAHPWELLYLGAVTTSLANWVQTKAQRNVTAERASVIYAMDPVWGAMWSNAILGETLSSFGVLGAGVITVAAATNAFLDFGEKKDI